MKQDDNSTLPWALLLLVTPQKHATGELGGDDTSCFLLGSGFYLGQDQSAHQAIVWLLIMQNVMALRILLTSLTLCNAFSIGATTCCIINLELTMYDTDTEAPLAQGLRFESFYLWPLVRIPPRVHHTLA